MRPTRAVFFALLLLCCCGGGGGCPGQAGGPCDPNEQKCEYGYYCAQIGICTKKCTTEDDCQAQRQCTASSQCKAGETCTSGLCGPVLGCFDEHCQASCAVDGGCSYDPYMPWARSGDPKGGDQ